MPRHKNEIKNNFNRWGSYLPVLIRRFVYSHSHKRNMVEKKKIIQIFDVYFKNHYKHMLEACFITLL